MGKVIITLRGASGDDAWCSRVRSQIARELLALGVPRSAVNVRDGPVRQSLMTLTTFGADRKFDTVPTSRYLFRSPFTTEATR